MTARHAPRERLALVHAHTPDAEHHHFAGASMSLTAAAYRRLGGIEPLEALEDEALERALRAHGLRDRPAAVRARAHLGAPARPGHRRTGARSRPRDRSGRAHRHADVVRLSQPQTGIHPNMGGAVKAVVEQRLDDATTVDGPNRTLMRAQMPFWALANDLYFRAEFEGWEKLPEPAVAAGQRPRRRCADHRRLGVRLRLVPALRRRAHPSRHRPRRPHDRPAAGRLLQGVGRHPRFARGRHQGARRRPRRDRLARRRAGLDAQLASPGRGRARRPPRLRQAGDQLRRADRSRRHRRRRRTLPSSSPRAAGWPRASTGSGASRASCAPPRCRSSRACRSA